MPEIVCSLNFMESIINDIHSAALKFLRPQSPLETYQVIVDESVKIFDGAFGNIVLENDGKLEKVYGSTPFMYTVQNRKRANTYSSFKQNKVIISRGSTISPAVKKFGITQTIYIPLSYDGEVLGVLNISRKQEARFNEQLNNSLRLLGSLSALAIKKSHMMYEVKKTLEVRDFFINLVSHQLRTPLTTINGYIQRLKNGTDRTSDRYSLWLNRLSQETTKLNQLVEQLIEVNKLKAGIQQFALEYCKLKDVTGKALQEINEKYPTKEFILKDMLSQDGIIVDSHKVQKALVGILDNACKFSPLPTPVQITLRNKNKKVHIVIADKGRGIDKHDIPHIMSGFYNPVYREEKGLVLGLFMAEKIVHHHKGTIKLTSAKGMGTKVDISFPLTKL